MVFARSSRCQPCQRCQPWNICHFLFAKNFMSDLSVIPIPTAAFWTRRKSPAYKFPNIPSNSLILQCLTYCTASGQPVPLWQKHRIMDLRRLFWKIMPEHTYSVREAAHYLGIHRCTIYAYISHPEKPLPFSRTEGNLRLRFLGEDLILFKKTGFPKKGRKRKNSGRWRIL